MSNDKRQLRAEAVERLREYHDWEPSQKSLANITLPIWPMSVNMNNDQRVDALIDLLTDDEHPAEQIVIEEPDTIRNEFEDNGLLVDDEAEQDTREKLEADACTFVARAWEAGRTYERRDWNTRCEDVAWSSDELIILLDRQAALDRKEFETILEGIQECMRSGSR